MGIFDNLRRKRELEKAESAAQENPSPLTLSYFAERLMAFGETDRALDVARKAMESFPDNERVVSTYRYIMKTHHQHRIAELQHTIERAPTPAGFARLAELYYHELADLDGAMEVTRRGISLFPEDESLHQIDGLIRFHRFHEDFLAKDGLSAVEHFEKAVAINHLNYRCLFHLGILYAEVEAFRKARQIVHQIQRFAPDDEGVRSLEDRLNVALAARPGAEESIDILFRNVEVRGRLSEVGQQFSSLIPGEPVTKPQAMNLDPRRLQELLQGFDSLEGFQAAVVVDTSGRLMAAHGKGAIREDALARLTFAIHQTAEESSKRMDIGSFNRGEIETASGTLHVIEIRNLVLGVGAAASARRDQVNSALDVFLDGVAKDHAVAVPK